MGLNAHLFFDRSNICFSYKPMLFTFGSQFHSNNHLKWMDFFCGISLKKKGSVCEPVKQTKRSNMFQNIVCGVQSGKSEDCDDAMSAVDDPNTNLKPPIPIPVNQPNSVYVEMATIADTPHQWPEYNIRPIAAEMPTPAAQSSPPYRRLAPQQQQERSQEQELVPLLNDYDDDDAVDGDGCVLPKYRRIESRPTTSAVVAAIERSLGLPHGLRPLIHPNDGNVYDKLQWPYPPPPTPSSSPPPTPPPRATSLLLPPPPPPTPRKNKTNNGSCSSSSDNNIDNKSLLKARKMLCQSLRGTFDRREKKSS